MPGPKHFTLSRTHLKISKPAINNKPHLCYALPSPTWTTLTPTLEFCSSAFFLVGGLINSNDGVTSKEEFQHLATQCTDNNLALNTRGGLQEDQRWHIHILVFTSPRTSAPQKCYRILHSRTTGSGTNYSSLNGHFKKAA